MVESVATCFRAQRINRRVPRRAVFSSGTYTNASFCPARLALFTVAPVPYNDHMPTNVERVLKDALSLSDAEREELVIALELTLAPVDIDPAWKAELARRIAKIESGEAVLHDAELHAKQLRAKFDASSNR